MKSKSFVITTISLMLAALISIGCINIIIDPLFQYHKPWFGLEPAITNERYQNAGIAKNFDFDNVIIGNSLSQNFKPSDFNKGFGGTTVKLTAAGSHTVDWTYVLNILNSKDMKPSKIVFNIDPYIFNTSATDMKHDLPIYLYDDNLFNDVNYIFNFSILKDYTFKSLRSNFHNEIPDYDKAFMWGDEVGSGKEFVLSHYVRPEIVTATPDINSAVDLAIKNINNLISYIEQMKNTEFNFYFSPFSMLYWDSQIRTNRVELWKTIYIEVCDLLLNYENVNVYLWTDKAMFESMSDLDNYTDDAHYSPVVSSDIAKRICARKGILTVENYILEIDVLFDYINTFDYELMFK